MRQIKKCLLCWLRWAVCGKIFHPPGRQGWLAQRKRVCNIKLLLWRPKLNPNSKPRVFWDKISSHNMWRHQFLEKCHWNRQSTIYWKKTVAIFPLSESFKTPLNWINWLCKLWGHPAWVPPYGDIMSPTIWRRPPALWWSSPRRGWTNRWKKEIG